MTQIFKAIAQVRQQAIDKELKQIAQFFSKFNSPYYYISYSDFCNNFQVHAGKNFKQENLNIIETHLKYRQWIYEQMAPYKWTPILVYTLLQLVRLRRPPLIFPLVYTSIFDYYFHPFFVWYHKDDKIINMQYQFGSKLSKVKNKEKRLKLFKKLQRSLKRLDELKPNQAEIPHKYIKFGSTTEYIFHALPSPNTQMSSVLQTPLFQNYMFIKNASYESISNAFNKIIKKMSKFLAYKSSADKKKYFLNLEEFMKFKDIRENQPFQLSTCIQDRVRRLLQVYMYQSTNNLFTSKFTLDKILFLQDHQHLTEEKKYKIDQNFADLTIYYALVLIPTFFLKILKR